MEKQPYLPPQIRSVAVLKRWAARTQPWRKSEEMENASEIVPFTLITLWVDEYSVLMMSTSFGVYQSFLESFSYASECDAAVKCGSARGKAALLRSVLRKVRYLYTRGTYVCENIWNRQKWDTSVFGSVCYRTFSFPEWKHYGEVPVGGYDNILPDECEKRKYPADDWGLHLISVDLLLYRRFRELCLSSVFGFQPISRLPLVG